MRLRIAKLIRFYDHKDERNRTHAAAVTGVIGQDLALAAFGHLRSLTVTE